MSKQSIARRSAALWILGLGAAAAATAAVDGASMRFDGVPGISAPFAEAVAARLAARGATPLGWSPKGALLIATRFGETTQLHLVAAAGGERRQLTFFRDPVAAGAFSPDPWHDLIVFAKDEAGRELHRLYLLDAAGGPARPLTDGVRDARDPLWSNDGRSIAFAEASADGHGEDVDVLALPAAGPAAAPTAAPAPAPAPAATPASAAAAPVVTAPAPAAPVAAPRVLVAGNGAFAVPLDWSPDDHLLLVREQLANGDVRLDAIDLEAGGRRALVAPGAGPIPEAKFARDGRGVYLISARDGEYRELRYCDLFGGSERRVSVAGAGDVEDFALSRDGRYLAYAAARGGEDRLHLVDLSTQRELPVPALPAAGVISSLHFDLPGRRLAFAYAAPNRPRDAYVLDLSTSSLQPWTQSEPGAADPATFVLPVSLEVPTFDLANGRVRELTVHAFAPAGGGAHPVLILFHSRPDAAFHAGFDPWIQYVVGELGYAVLVPDLRGSLGEGRSFASLDDRRQRGDVIKDIGALLIWLEGRPQFAARHVVVAGRSYGGYLALLAAANYSDRLRGVVDWSGIADLPTWLDGLPPALQPAARAEFGDERDPGTRAFLRNLSPLALADRISKQVLIVHGGNDARVALAQAEEMADLLRSHRVQVSLVVANHEGHRFAAQSDRDAAYAAFAQFLISAR